MRRFRFTISRMLLTIIYCSIALGAVRSPSWIWASVCFTSVVTSLAAATLTAVYRLGTRRAFWTGFAFCGWLYLGLTWNPWSGSSLSPLIVTTALMDMAYSTVGGLGRTSGIGVTAQSIWDYWSQPPRNVVPFNWGVPEPFRVICHSLLTPFVALPGGLLAKHLHRTRDDVET
jgi:hypothetical protein